MESAHGVDRGMKDEPTAVRFGRAAVSEVKAAHPYLAESCAHTAPGQVS